MINNQYKNLSEVFKEAMNLKGVNVEKLADLSDIPERYLKALENGDLKNLPPSPYARGYLMKIALILNIDGEFLWQLYKKENELKISGPLDFLPSNRFAFSSSKKKFIVFGIIIIFAIIYLAWNLTDFFGTPDLKIVNPAENSVIINSDSIKLSGQANPADKLTINGEETLIKEDGSFEKEFVLEAGLNTIEFKIKRFLGKEKKEIKQVIYQP
ncbi:helix-turn-helix domain-containing protein [Candidatus Wolfebacteria bacterium]|nr:helix-turn-helix domain-containing protein [Candidatus Wolfebacteria bacterium]